jgi:hypothetical protein
MVGVAILVLAVNLGAIVFFTRLNQERMYEEYATSNAYSNSNEKFKIECADLLSVEEVRQCFEDIIESAREPQRSEEDLRAQKEMAQWAFWMLIVTAFVGIVSIGVAMIGIYWIVRTWELQRVATVETIKATGAAIEAASAANHSAVLAAREFESRFKPWLNVKISGPYVVDDAEENALRKLQEGERRPILIKARIEIHNIGEMPATLVRIYVGLHSIEGLKVENAIWQNRDTWAEIKKDSVIVLGDYHARLKESDASPPPPPDHRQWFDPDLTQCGSFIMTAENRGDFFLHSLR